MFKQGNIYYPTDEKVLNKINKDITVFHCDVIVKYMDTMKFNDAQKEVVLDSIISKATIQKRASN